MDVGMYDGADTAYYLSLGYRVVAIEANPECVALANQRFVREIAAGKLTIENVAIGEKSGTVSLQLSVSDPGASSTIPDWIDDDSRGKSVEIPCVDISSLLLKYGTPFYLKCDIEGADRHCILGLGKERRPRYVSYEIGDDAIELLEHLAGIGYSDFKIINQVNFMELSWINSLRHRIRDKFYRITKRPSPSFIRRNWRRFRSGHSSGPMGEYTAGKWYSYEKTRFRWEEFCREYEPHRRTGWYDLHARLGT
jgi:FkbM family methyltransferase